jgi:glycosyltransferase involved in cell wall biosynthesis
MLNAMPLFSVIIPVYNRHAPVREAIDSVLGQTFADYELVVVDDGSTDGTREIEREYRGALRYVRREHGGVSAARNAGAGASSGLWLAFLDSDDRWLPEKLSRQALYIREHPDVGIHQTEEEWIRKGRRVNPKLKHAKREGRIFIDSLELCLISPSAAVMSRDFFERYGPFDEDLPACEDYDLWLRVTKDEFVGLIPEIQVVRNGGLPDQLSARYWGMDRFRVYSIMKMLARHGKTLQTDYRVRAVETALRKTRILLQGAKKRKNTEFAEKLQKIVVMLDEGRSNIDLERCRFLLNVEI